MCQFKYINEIKAEESSWDRRTELLRKKLLYVRWRVNLLRDKFIRRFLAIKPQNLNQPHIRPGEDVRVRSKREIQGMLDERRKYKKLGFLTEQYIYCGKRNKVLKELNYFYDEVKQKQVKCKDSVFLEDCYCSGIVPFSLRRCDLNCLLFWHKDWLEKI